VVEKRVCGCWYKCRFGKITGKFCKKNKFPFSLIADEDKNIIKAYDVSGIKNTFEKKVKA